MAQQIAWYFGIVRGFDQHQIGQGGSAGLDPAEFTLADLNMPLYDGDVEERDGIPAWRRRF